MPILLWDASALAKRYAAEVGSETVNALFAELPLSQMVATFLGYAETYSLLVRKHNRGILDTALYTASVSALQDEIVDNADFGLLHIEYEAILDAIALITDHNINASDASILVTYLRYARAWSPLGMNCVLVASDQRFLRAANAEGLQTLNPELLPAADVPALLARIG